MIGRIQGQLVEVCDNTVLVDVQGVCYELEVTSTALAGIAVPAARASSGVDQARAVSVQLYTHFVVREDAQLLYGFASRDERDLFRALIRINGVGPKLALSLISSVDLGELARSVRDNDTAALTRVPGVGRKTAERLVVELKDRLADLVLVAEVPAEPAPTSAAQEAERALVALGYKPHEAQRVVESLGTRLASTEEIVRAALKHIAQQAEVAS